MLGSAVSNESSRYNCLGTFSISDGCILPHLRDSDLFSLGWRLRLCLFLNLFGGDSNV